MTCSFCSREIKNKGSLKAHENTCKSNPNRVKYEHSPLAGTRKGATPWNKGQKIGKHERWELLYPDEQIFIENSSHRRAGIKKRILDKNLIPYICACCGIGPIWQGKEMPLILDHINGINNDNRIENLRFVCSNCDTQLPTYKSKNRRKD